MTYVNQINASGYYAGQIANSDPYAILTQPNTDTVVIPFGVAMIQDGTNQGYKLPSVIGDITNRMALNLIINRNSFYSYDASLNPLIGTNNSVPVGNNCAGCTLGYIAVTVEDAVLQGGQCFIRYATGTGTQKGAFRSNADSTTAAAHPNWYYATAAAAGTIAIVRVI